MIGGIGEGRTANSLEAIARADLTPLQAEIAHIMAAVRNALADQGPQLKDMSNADIIAFVRARITREPK
jgi:hypothetical protein